MPRRTCVLGIRKTSNLMKGISMIKPSIQQTFKPSSNHLVSCEALHRFTMKAFQRVGLSAADTKVGADILVLTDAWGTFSHGTKSLHDYLRKLKAGGLCPGQATDGSVTPAPCGKELRCLPKFLPARKKRPFSPRQNILKPTHFN